jgi:hypothetical protein
LLDIGDLVFRDFNDGRRAKVGGIQPLDDFHLAIVPNVRWLSSAISPKAAKRPERLWNFYG